MCDWKKKSKFIKQQKASTLLSSLAIKTPLSKIFSVGPFLFSCKLFKRKQSNNPKI